MVFKMNAIYIELAADNRFMGIVGSITFIGAINL